MSAQYGTTTPLLDARLEGSNIFNAPVGTNKFYYNFSHEQSVDNVVFNGVSLFAKDSNMGDKISLWTEYYVPQLDQWKRYKKFVKGWNVAPNTLMKDILFPTTPSNGVRVVFEYTNTGSAPVDFFVNMYNFVDQRKVSPSELEEGLDW